MSVSDSRIVPAIELLRKEEPGAFVIRDSSSYRGSFGLALKVKEVPPSAQNRPGMHLSLCSLKVSRRQRGVVASSPGSGISFQGDMAPVLKQHLGEVSTPVLSPMPSSPKAP